MLDSNVCTVLFLFASLSLSQTVVYFLCIMFGIINNFKVKARYMMHTIALPTHVLSSTLNLNNNCAFGIIVTQALKK